MLARRRTERTAGRGRWPRAATGLPPDREVALPGSRRQILARRVERNPPAGGATGRPPDRFSSGDRCGAAGRDSLTDSRGVTVGRAKAPDSTFQHSVPRSRVRQHGPERWRDSAQLSWGENLSTERPRERDNDYSVRICGTPQRKRPTADRRLRPPTRPGGGSRPRSPERPYGDPRSPRSRRRP
jgi:hypothetical protein